MAQVEMISEVPPLVCDPAMTDEMVSYMEELPIPGLTPVPDTSASASAVSYTHLDVYKRQPCGRE